MANGFDNTTFSHNAYLKQVESVIYWNNWLLGEQGEFEIVPANACPGGTVITIPIEYATTFNGGTYAYSDPAPTSDDVSEVAGYFTKDGYQAGARVYKMQIQQQEVNYNGKETLEGKREQANRIAGANLRDYITTTAVTDLIAQIDSAGTWSDASLTRSTYSLASYEDTAGGVITLRRMEDAIEALTNTTYGPVPEGDLVWCCPRNQLTRIAEQSTGNMGTELQQALYTFSASSESSGNIDGGRTYRVKSMGGIRLIVVPDMSTTDILLLDRNVVKVFMWQDVAMEDKTAGVMANQEYRLYTAGVNFIAVNPKRCAKISGLTA